MRVALKVLAVLMLLAGCAKARQPPAGSGSIRELSREWARYYAEVYQVPIELVEAIIEEESEWNPYAVSKKGAAGLMQLMPKTAVRFGVRNRFRIEQNIQGGVAYLGWLSQQFSGDLRLVTAAYYVGESSIRLRGLAYANPGVHDYVERVAQRYRARRARAVGTVARSREK